MKSAFAEKEVVKYVYPAPLKKGDERIDAEVMKAIEDDNEEAPWIKMRIPHATGDMNAIADATQLVLQGSGTNTVLLNRIAKANREVFEQLAEEWSFDDVKPTGEKYESLQGWAGTWANAVLADARDRGTVLNPKAPSSETSSSKPEPTRGGRRKAPQAA